MVSVKEKRNRQINLRLTATEQLHLNILAHQRWRNVSEYIRRLVNRDWERLKKIEGIAKVNAIVEKMEGSGNLWPEDVELDVEKFRK